MDEEFECVAGHFTKALLNSIYHPTSKPDIQVDDNQGQVHVSAKGRTERGRYISMYATYEHRSPSQETKPDGEPEKYTQTNRVDALTEVSTGGPKYASRLKLKKAMAANSTDTLSRLENKSVRQVVVGNTVEKIEAQRVLLKALGALHAAPARCGLDATR